jgi:hypothetical protein
MLVVVRLKLWKDHPYKFPKGYLIERIELFIHKVAYSQYDVSWFLYWW